MNYADIRPFDAVNGIGIGTTLFVSGCLFHCKNCFNKEAWDFDYGKPFTKEVEDYFINCAKISHTNHVSLLGGEEIYQDLNIILNLVKRIKTEVNKPIWIWSGFTYEELIKSKPKLSILKYIDVLVDGQFKQELKDINLKLRGSSNQRIINVQESLKQNKVIEYKEYY